MFKRAITSTIIDRLSEKRSFIQIILGPRQVGKSTAIRQVIKELSYPSVYALADLPVPPDHRFIAQNWDEARNLAKGGKKVILVLDEVQKIEGWSNVVKKFWDEDTHEKNNIQVVLLGSSALMIQKKLPESLAGRFEIIRFTHWSYLECHKAFGCNLDDYLFYGGYPGGYELIKDEVRWKQFVTDSLIETAITRDIMILADVQKPVLLRRLLYLGCEYGGQILSYGKILGDLNDVGSKLTLMNYQKYLESAYLMGGLQAWKGSGIYRQKSPPKWLPLNTALMTALSAKSKKEMFSDRQIYGRLVEVAVGAYIYNQALVKGFEVYYWREDHDEIDFVVRKGEKLLGIEVKTGFEYGGKAFDIFQRQYPKAKTLLVGEYGVNIEKFLSTPIEEYLN
jgi:hypothetical protein